MLSFIAICASLLLGLVVSQEIRPVDQNNLWLSLPGLPGLPIDQDPNAYSTNELWRNGEIHVLSWRAAFPVIVRCLQETQIGGRYVNVYNGTGNATGWTVSVNEDWFRDGNVFFFAVYNRSTPDGGPQFYSHYFNITSNATTTSAPPTNGTGGPIVSSTPETGGGGSSNGAAIGAGVGGGLGAVLIAALIFGCWFWRRRNKRKNAEKVEAPIVNEQPGSGMPSPPPPGVVEKGDHYPFHGSYAPGSGYASASPPQSPEPAPAYNKSHEVGAAHEVSADDQVANRHELDASTERRGGV